MRRKVYFGCEARRYQTRTERPECSNLIVTKCLAKHETKVIAQTPYSSDFAPCDFSLFPKHKYPLRRTRHELIEAIKRNSLKELKAIPAEAYKHYKSCMENWIKRWHQCAQI